VAKKVTFLIVAIVAFSILCTQGYAIQVVMVNKPKVRLSIPSGSSYSGTIEVENRSSDAKDIRLYLEDWVYLPEQDGSKEFKPASTTGLSCAEWINFAPPEFTLPPFSKQLVHYTVRVPEGIQGGHYAVLFFEDLLSTPSQEGVSVGMAIRVASLFYIEAEGTIRRAAELKNLSLVKRDEALLISADFKNMGNIDITTDCSYSIIDERGIVYARGEFNPVYTLPGDAGRIESIWKDGIPPGEFDLIITLNLGGGIAKVSESRVSLGAKPEVIRFGALE
jgi:hypothetical protein